MTAPTAETVDLRCSFGNQTRLKCKECTRFLKAGEVVGVVTCKCGAVYYENGTGLWVTKA